MVLIDTKNSQKRLVHAPRSQNSLTPPTVLSVELNEDEDVQWQWTHYPNGESVVTGYTIVKKENSQQLEQ